MRDFAALFETIDQSTKTTNKVKALARYFQEADPQDRLWTIALFSGRRPKRAVTTAKLREWGAEAASIPLWLFEECYPVVGDLAETIALILPSNSTTNTDSLSLWIRSLRNMNNVEEPTQKNFLSPLEF